MLRRVRANKTMQERPQRSRLGGFGILGIAIDDGFVYDVGGFRNIKLSIGNGLYIFMQGHGPYDVVTAYIGFKIWERVFQRRTSCVGMFDGIGKPIQ